ncbi:MAG: YkgJ family cysteine cluster protein [Sedimentisphaerales bacterium]|nr:YkgJ family cysteine cluster protein [Sedimentisphaerales bacterium]
MVEEAGDLPWFAAGLRFSCTKCGRCCSGPAEGYIWVDMEQIAQIAAFLKIPVERFKATYTRTEGPFNTLIEDPHTKDCIFLEASGPIRQCAIYPVRPPQCRTWPFWPSNLTTPQAWQRASRRCPGINHGRLYTYQQILQLCGACSHRI